VARSRRGSRAARPRSTSGSRSSAASRKLRGFENRFKVEYEVVNLGAIARLVELGALEPGELPGAKPTGKPAPVTVNQEILRATGLVRTLDKPLKILGHGEISTALFVVADAFSRTAIAKIEAAGGTVNVLEVPGASAPSDQESAAAEG
jgi:large subunit ribosomal protein L15